MKANNKMELRVIVISTGTHTSATTGRKGEKDEVKGYKRTK